MNIKTILFSKEHIISPFKIIHNNQEISIRNKKIKTIALSILVGIFTAGIGGILLFYWLSAKYKVEKLNKSQNRVTVTNTSTSPMKSKNPMVSLADRKSIEVFVERFLHPYITGQISKETDPKDRKPMIELLYEKMTSLEPSMKEEVKEIALNAFFKQAALGLYVNQKNRKCAPLTFFTSRSPQFNILIDALTEALPKEFPGLNLSAQNLRGRAMEALWVVNQERKSAQKKALNYNRAGDPRLRSHKLQQLQDSRKIWL